jgi:hypothetical protein
MSPRIIMWIPVGLGLVRGLLSLARSACSVSDCELTETYSPAAMDMAAGYETSDTRKQYLALGGLGRSSLER